MIFYAFALNHQPEFLARKTPMGAECQSRIVHKMQKAPASYRARSRGLIRKYEVETIRPYRPGSNPPKALPQQGT